MKNNFLIEIKISGRILTSSRLVVIRKGEKEVDWAVVRRDSVNWVCEEPRLICGERAIYRKHHLKGMVKQEQKKNKLVRRKPRDKSHSEIHDSRLCQRTLSAAKNSLSAISCLEIRKCMKRKEKRQRQNKDPQRDAALNGLLWQEFKPKIYIYERRVVRIGITMGMSDSSLIPNPKYLWWNFNSFIPYFSDS